MVQFVAFTVVLASLLPSLVSAAACTDGLIYCGYNLLKRGTTHFSLTSSQYSELTPNPTGAYKSEIVAELERVGDPVDPPHIYYSTFACGAGGHGWIRYISYCENGCYDGGSGRNDHC